MTDFLPGDKIEYDSAINGARVTWTRGEDGIWRTPDRNETCDDPYVDQMLGFAHDLSVPVPPLIFSRTT